MKANAPEKIYSIPTEGGFYLTTIKPEPPFADGIEYIRKDAFIKKLEMWLNKWHKHDRYTLIYFRKHFKNIINEIMEG